DDGDFAANSVTMPFSMMESFYGVQPTQDLLLKVAPGTTPEEVVDGVYAAHLDPALRAQDPATLARMISDSIKGSFNSFWAIQRAAVVVLVVIVAAAALPAWRTARVEVVENLKYE